jgi:hypothetical protein
MALTKKSASSKEIQGRIKPVRTELVLYSRPHEREK